MKLQYLVILLVVVIALAASGCMRVAQTVKVNRDGSGMVVEEVTVSGAVVEMIEQFAAGMGQAAGGEAEAESTFSAAEMFPEEQFVERAERMGPGVTFVSRDLIMGGDGSVGYRARFDVEDVNTLVLTTSGQHDMISGPDTNTPVSFELSQGIRESTLVVHQHFPEQEEEGPAEEVPEAQSIPFPSSSASEGMAMVKALIGDMGVRIVLECGDRITSTTATNWEENKIVLLDFDLGKLLSHPEKLEMISSQDRPDTREEFIELMKGITGVTFDVQERIEVVFK